MTPNIDTSHIELKTITQILRKWHLTELPNSYVDLMAETERIHLSMAFTSGQLNKLTFDEWYDKTFSKEDK
jgi:hypothetical protein